MTTINTRIPYAQAGGGGSGEDSATGAPMSVYRTRGVIDINLNRLPTANDISIVVSEAIVPLDAFVCTSAGTPTSGVTGATSVVPGDYLVYISGTVTVASSWCAINNATNLSAGMLPNAVPGWVRVIGTPGSDSGTA